MNKKIFENKRTNETCIKIEHPSGLDIYVKPMENYASAYALFGTKYGSINNRFKTDDEADFITVPDGIAHYLEHKLFENEDCDAFARFAKTGASANAYTSFDRTCYLFSAADNIYESLEILLDFVQAPYFTAETVAKEQGIIGQEIRMYNDDPTWAVVFNMLKSVYHNHPVRIDIAGTVESIAEITPELLYKCYNAFYNLNNMVLSIAGNVDPERVIEICDKILKPTPDKGLKSEALPEPLDVVQKEIEVTSEVSIPLFNIGFKAVPEEGVKGLKAETETNLLLSLLAGPTSTLFESLYAEGLINSTFSTEVFSGPGYFTSIMGGESRNPKEVQKRINAAINDAQQNGMDMTEFESVKKAFYGGLIRDLNKAESYASNMIVSAFDGVSPYDAIEIIAQITPADIEARLKRQFDTEKSAISIVNPKVK
ncbi:MAG: insulinase family protein [Ruminococcus sp.]|jgi:predicted Zn-dependent peptidase|nr:insulinase family protein [Ruminococcus sp.]